MAIAAIALIAGLTVATAATWNLQMSQRVENQQVAIDLADSALQEAIANLQKNPQWGLTGSPTVTVNALPGMNSDAKGTLTFDRTQPVFSTSHIDGNSQPAWSGRPLAAGRIHLVAVGRCGGLERRVETMVYSPKFPRAISSDGPIELRRAFVASAKDLSEVIDGSGQFVLTPEHIRKGDVISNDVTSLQQASRVTGAVQAKNSVEIRDGSIVEGELLTPYEQCPLPQFNVQSYDPKNDPDTLCEELPGGTVSPTTVDGIRRYSGALTVTGDLKLDNAIVYVAGDVTIQGSLTGVGALFVDGQAAVGGAVHLNSSDSIALIAKGDVRLRGDGQEQSFFQGLLATQGALSADKLTVVGALVAKSRVYISDCRVVQVGSQTTLQMFRPVQVVQDAYAINGNPGTLGGVRGTDPDFMLARISKNVNSGGKPSRELPVKDLLLPEFRYWNSPNLLEVGRVNGQFAYRFLAQNASGDLKEIKSTVRATFVTQVKAHVSDTWLNNHPHLIAAIRLQKLANFMQSFSAGLEDALSECENFKPKNAELQAQTNFNLSLNRFISESEKLRVVYRREL